MRVTHSLLHPEDVAELVEREYTIAAPVKVGLLNRGFNDAYLVTDVEGGRRVLRVYNREKYWIRSESDLRFELDLLEHLAAAELGVIRPYQRAHGDRLGRLIAPEGQRHFALFTHAPGTPLNEGTLNAEQWHAYGSDIARMHQRMDTFSTSHDRYHLDERMLIERPLAGLAPYARARPRCSADRGFHHPGGDAGPTVEVGSPRWTTAGPGRDRLPGRRGTAGPIPPRTRRVGAAS